MWKNSKECLFEEDIEVCGKHIELVDKKSLGDGMRRLQLAFKLLKDPEMCKRNADVRRRSDTRYVDAGGRLEYVDAGGTL